MHSSTATLLSFPVNDDDDDRLMSKCTTDMPTTTNDSKNSLSQLCYAVKELEKVNCQLFQLLNTLETPAIQMKPSLTVLSNQQPSAPEPWIEHIHKCVIHEALPPTPNPTMATILSCAVPQLSPVMTVLPCNLPWLLQSKQTTIHNWAKPAIPDWVFPQLLPPAPNPAAGHWPLPRPSLKTAPCKKKPQTKPTVECHLQDKDSLQPP